MPRSSGHIFTRPAIERHGRFGTEVVAASGRWWLFLLLALGLTLPVAAQAQEPAVPNRFVTISSNTDLPGNDLQMLTGVTLERCQAACLRTGECAAFTFNIRAGACFLKSAAGPAAVFADAVSGVIGERDAATIASAEAAASELDFLTDYDLRTARDQAAGTPARYPANGRSEDELLNSAAVANGDRAVELAGAATSVVDSGRAWLVYARMLIARSTIDKEHTYELASQARSASINAALRSGTSDRAEALLVMARALQATYRGEDALRALQLADRLVPGIAPEELARLRDAFGFRVLSTDVDARSAAPRICVTFSQELVPDEDYGPFVQRSTASFTVEAEGPQICVGGVEYGQSYAFTLRAGLPSAEGDVLVANVPLQVYVRDRDASVRFPGSSYVLPAQGPRALPIETVNANRLKLKLLRVSDRNLAGLIRSGQFLAEMSSWGAASFEAQQTEEVWAGEIDLDGALNRTTTSRVPLDVVGELLPGMYVLRADLPEGVNGTSPALQWFLISDLGVTTLSGTDGVHVVVQRLSDGQPQPNATVALVARSNRVLAEATTNAAGLASFPAALALGPGSSAPAMVLVEVAGDLAVLSLVGPEFDLSDRGVTGRVAPGPIDVFITTDRGAYRPGENVAVTALVRDDQAKALQGLPLTLSFLRPDGVEYDRRVLTSDDAGGHVTELALGANVPRGVWRIELFVDPKAPALASYQLLVEDFIPDRIAVDLGLTGSAPINPAAPPSLTLQADYLFGAPAAGLTVTGSVSVAPTSELAGWQGYTFGRADQRQDTQRFALPAGLATDGAGHVMVPLPLSRLTLEPRPYEATVVASALEGSSRPVERVLTRAVRPPGPVVGVRPADGAALPENSEAHFDLVIVNPDGEMGAGQLEWRVDRIQTRYQWYSVNGDWYWEPITERERVGEGTATIDGAPASVSVPVDWGRYELRATQVGALASAPPASASLQFTAGWVPADSATDTPDFLEVSLDAASYVPGDVARLRLQPDEPGVALVSVLAGRVIDLRLVEVNGETVVELPVTEEWGAGAYVTASLVHPSNGPEHVPSRALGVAHAAVDPGARALAVQLTAPEEMRSDTTMTVLIEVPGLAGSAAFATVAAVDVGVLNITAFQAPDPLGHYFGQRRLGVGIRDLYGRLIDARQGAMGEVRSGGDSGGEVATGPVPAAEVVALFSGPVELVDGRAAVTFEVPAFDGTLRLMAVVWTEEAVGQATGDVLVRDPVVVQASLPRFMTPLDESRLRLEFTLVAGTPGEARLQVEGQGLGAVPSSITLARGTPLVVEVPLVATELGEHIYRVSVTTPDGEVITREVRLSTLYTDPETARSSRVELAPGASTTIDSSVLAGFRPDSARATVTAGVGGAIDLPGLLLRLNGPGYGSSERVASQLLALLLAPEQIKELGLLSAAELTEQVQTSVARLLTRQGANGAFGGWFAGGYDLWLSAYVTDVLLHAEEAGAGVPADALRAALDNLRNEVASAGSLRGDASPYAYAYYVLARAGDAAVGDLRYYADTLAEAFDTPLAAAQLGAALALYGDDARANRLFAQAQRLALAPHEVDEWRDDYGTALRDQAGLLALAAEAHSSAVDLPLLAATVAAGRGVARLSSQETAWELRAAVALGSSTPGLELNGSPVTGRLAYGYSGAPAVLHNAGQDAIVLTITTLGVADEPPAPSGEGYEISRTLYTLEGLPADLSKIRVGDRLAVVLDVRPDRGVPGGRLLVNDALPAGFELDNANLLRSGDVRELDWLQFADVAEFTEARADRFLAAVEQNEAQPFRLAYIVRAVSPGSFHYPAPLVEDLYRPTNRAVGETGRLTIGE